MVKSIHNPQLPACPFEVRTRDACRTVWDLDQARETEVFEVTFDSIRYHFCLKGRPVIRLPERLAGWLSERRDCVAVEYVGVRLERVSASEAQNAS